MQIYKIIFKKSQKCLHKERKILYRGSLVKNLCYKYYKYEIFSDTHFDLRSIDVPHEYVYEICVTKSRKQSYHIAHLEFNSKSRAQRGTKYTRAYTAITLLEMCWG